MPHRNEITQEEITRIVSSLARRPEGASTVQLADLWRMKRERAYGILRKLQGEGRVIQRGHDPHNNSNHSLWWRKAHGA